MARVEEHQLCGWVEVAVSLHLTLKICSGILKQGLRIAPPEGEFLVPDADRNADARIYSACYWVCRIELDVALLNHV